MDDLAKRAVEEASETPKDKFLKALATLPASAALNEGFHGTNYENSAAPLKDSTAVFLQEADLNVAEEFKLMSVLVQKVFKFTKTGQEADGQRWIIDGPQRYLNFLKLARERYAEVADDEFWRPYFNLVASEAAKHMYPMSRGRSAATSVREQEQAKDIVEEIHAILPLQEIENYRKAFAAMVRTVILHDAELVYRTALGNTPPRDLGTTMAAAQKYSVQVPSEIEFWETTAIAKFTELLAEFDNLANSVQDKDFGSKYYTILDRIKNTEHAFNRAKALVQAVEVRGEKKSIDVFLSDMKSGVDELALANKNFQIDQEFAKISAVINTFKVEDINPAILESMIADIKKLGDSDSEKLIQIKNGTIEKIDLLLGILLGQIQADNSRAAEIAPRIAQIGKWRNQIA